MNDFPNAVIHLKASEGEKREGTRRMGKGGRMSQEIQPMKGKRKQLRHAMHLKAQVRKQRLVMAALAVVCAVALAVYFHALLSGLFEESPFSSAIVLVIAIIVGTFSVKATRARRLYEDYLRDKGLTKEDVKAQERYEREKGD